MNVWLITQEEKIKSDQHFHNLGPVNGFITGEQARGFMTQSRLAANELAQIWSLADLNKDGKMDEREFAICVALIHRRMQGNPVPQILPQSLLVDPMQQQQSAWNSMGSAMTMPPMQTPMNMPSPTPMMGGSMTMGGMGMPHHTMTNSMPPMSGMVPIPPPVASPIKQISNWVMPQNTKLKHSQTFNSIDKNRVGYLTGTHARNILTQSGLNTGILGQIWNLSDLDKDGKLTVDEFCIAMFLADMAILGHSLPTSTPPELANPSHSSSHIDVHSFEDRRKENFSKGQAELERRRQILLEQEKNERERRETKEREQRERMERERMEMERRRHLELEKEAARQRQIDAHRAEEQRKVMQQREAARREMEKQRRHEMDRHTINEMTAERERDTEAMCHTKQKQKNLTFQLQALNERAVELNDQISDMRSNIVGNTSDIEAMKRNRDDKLNSIQTLNNQMQEAQFRLSGLSSERLDLQQRKGNVVGSANPVNDSLQQVVHSLSVKQANMQSLKDKLSHVDKELTQTQNLTAERDSHLTSLQQKYTQAVNNNERLHEQFEEKRMKAMQMVHSSNLVPSSSHNGFVESTPMEVPTSPSSKSSLSGARLHSTVKYRALYQFDARGPDELSFQPGDTILVFKDHDCESGWLAGQIRDKVGWFPEAFAELSTSPTSAPQTIDDPDVEPSKLDDIVEEDDSSSLNAPPMNNAHSNENQMNTVLATAIAQYPFKAKKDTQLTLTLGDVINVVHQDEMWWKGECNGKTGWFLKSYVKLNDEIEPTTASPVTSPENAASTKLYPVLNENEGDWYITIYEFPAQEATDLSFMVDERVFVTHKEGDWWTGRIGEKTGIFPANYVRKENESVVVSPVTPVIREPEIEKPVVVNVVESQGPTEVAKVIAPFEATAANQLSLQQGDMIRIRTKSPTGWWEGELQRKGQDRKIGWFPGNYVKVLSGNVSQSGSKTSELCLMTAEQLTVLFDYCAQQDDELNLTAGQVVQLLERVDQDWWKGRTSKGEEGIFPATYVQLESRCVTPQLQTSQSTSSIQGITHNTKAHMHRQELLETEEHYLQDLLMVDVVFRQKLAQRRLLTSHDLQVIFNNWEQLMQLSRDICHSLRDSLHNVGAMFMQKEQQLNAFVTFCQGQQTAINLLQQKEKTVSQVEDCQLLEWCTTHIAAVPQSLTFESMTNFGQPRKLLLSGILHKARSNRTLVGLLFNDLFLLCSPEEEMGAEDSFKITTVSPLYFSVYKTPLLLHTLGPPSSDEATSPAFTLTVDDEPLGLRAVSNNAYILWTRKLSEAIKQAKECMLTKRNEPRVSQTRGMGRLLIEMVCVRQLTLSPVIYGTAPKLFCVTQMGSQSQTQWSIDAQRKDSLFTTQMSIIGANDILHMSLYVEMSYSPDVLIGRFELGMNELMKTCAGNRTPVLKQIPLTHSQLDSHSEATFVIIKFVVQLFE